MKEYSPAKLCHFSGDLSKQWYIYYSVLNPETGKLQRFKLSEGLNVEKTLRDRKRKASVMVDEINRMLKSGWTPFDKTNIVQSLKATFDELLEVKKKALRRRSWQSYTYAANSFLRYLEANKIPVYTPGDVTPAIARQFTDSLVMAGKAGKTVNEVKDFLKSLFNMMLEREIISRNPFKGIPPQPETSSRNRAFTRQQLDRLWAAMTPGQRVFSKLIYYCYLRPVEITRLKVADVDLQAGVISISGEQSKNRKSQSVVVPLAFRKELAEYLKTYLQYSPVEIFLIGSRFRPNTRPISRNYVSRIFNELIDGQGYGQDYTLYSFKHSGVVAAYQAGIDLYSISRQLRHHSLTVTQIYLKSLGLMPNVEFAERMV